MRQVRTPQIPQRTVPLVPRLCEACGEHRAYFIEDDTLLCRFCAVIVPEHRQALNALLQAGLIYPKEET